MQYRMVASNREAGKLAYARAMFVLALIVIASLDMACCSLHNPAHLACRAGSTERWREQS